MNLVTLATLRSRVRARGNFGSATQLIPDTEINDHLNVSLATEVYDLVRANVGDNYYRSTATFTTNPAQADPSTYPLPSDFLSLMSVDIYLGTVVTPNTPAINSRRYNEEERNIYRFMPLGWNYGGWVIYSLLGQNIRFQPVPNNAYAVGVNYVPTAPQLAADTDTWDDINGYAEIAVLDAARKCFMKQRLWDAVQNVGAIKNELKAAARQALSNRNAGEPERPHLQNQLQWGDGWEPGG